MSKDSGLLPQLDSELDKLLQLIASNPDAWFCYGGDTDPVHDDCLELHKRVKQSIKALMLSILESCLGGETPQPPEDKEKLREKLAAIEHQRWADWQKWLHGKLVSQTGAPLPYKDGMLMLPSDYQRWEEQIAADYSELSDEEKASDMEQVDRYWPLIEEYIAGAGAASAHKDVRQSAIDKLRLRLK